MLGEVKAAAVDGGRKPPEEEEKNPPEEEEKSAVGGGTNSNVYGKEKMDNTRCTQSIQCQDEQQLYNELKSAVWATVEIHDDASVGMGTGFCVDPKGFIMTCSHCVKKKVSVATHNNADLRPTVLLYRNELWDVAVLCLAVDLKQPSTTNYPYVRLAENGTLVPGQDVYSISHQNRFMYSFSSGKVCYPCMNEINNFDPSSSTSKQARVVLSTTSEYRTSKEVSVADNVKLFDHLPLIEIMNLHMSGGGSGGPVLLPNREVVGMVSFVRGSKSFAVHVSVLQMALKQANEEYMKRMSGLRARLDEQKHLKNTEEVTEAGKSKEI